MRCYRLFNVRYRRFIATFCSALSCALAPGCHTTPGPEATARAYAAALREGRVDDAWALTSGAAGNAGASREAFDRQYADPDRRNRRAEAVEAAAPVMTAGAGAVTLVQANGGWRVVESDPARAARQALEAFLAAAEAGDFDAAYAQLAGVLRARYTPERLAQDFKAEPGAPQRLARARAALGQEPVIEGDEVRFPIGGGRAVRLILDEGRYRVLALE